MNERMKKIIFVVNPISGTQSKELILSLLNEKICSVNLAIIYYVHATFIKHFQCFLRFHGYMQVPCKSIARATRNDSQSGIRMHQRTSYLIDRSVSSDSYYYICLFLGSFRGYFYCMTGFDAFVSLKFAHAGKRGLLTYLEKTLQESLKYQPETYELETENGVTKYKAFLIACGNASQYGNNAYIAPQATLTDGLLDVTILEPFTVLDVPSLAFQLFNKTIDQNSRIKTFRCRRLCIRRTAPGVVHFDGDPMETDADVNIELIQRGLRVVVPQAAEKDAANVLQRAQEYMNGIKLMNEAIVDNITDRNKKILKKLTKKG